MYAQAASQACSKPAKTTPVNKPFYALFINAWSLAKTNSPNTHFPVLNDADRMKGTEILSRYNHNKAAAEFQAEMSDELLRRQLAKLELSPYVGFAIDETVRTIVSIYRSITLVHSSCLTLLSILCCFSCRRPC